MKKGKSYTKVNGRKYQTLFCPGATVFEDAAIEGRICMVDDSIRVSDLKKLPFFNDITIKMMGYKAK